MDTGYGQFICLDEDNLLDYDYKINSNINAKNSFSKIKKDIVIGKDMRGSMILMFMQYFCSLVDYFYKK